MIYQKALGATLSKFQDGFVIVKGTEIFRTNEVAARIFDLCNGTHLKEDIIVKLSEYYNTSQEIVEVDVTNFIEELISNKLVKLKK